jgi:hypothetical protein
MDLGHVNLVCLTRDEQPTALWFDIGTAGGSVIGEHSTSKYVEIACIVDPTSFRGFVGYEM